ncbi:MAG: hypothetical protein MJ057_00405 [Sphaerochaetaceae bacterium]|nr:hypothetical protein [Sphaerochaetaceae bacterium]
MKRLALVLLALCTVCAFAFAAIGNSASVSISAPSPKSSLTLNGIASASFEFDLDTMEGQFLKQGKFAHVDLSALKTVTKGTGGTIGTGDIYAVVDASFDLYLNLNVYTPYDKDSDSPYSVDVYQSDSQWVTEVNDFNNSTTFVSRFKFSQFYVAKEGFWKLDLMKSDTSLDYAVSAVDGYYLLNNDRLFYSDGMKQFFFSTSATVDQNTGATLTFQDNKIFKEISVGMVKKKFNVLVKTSPIMIGSNGYVEGGFVFGTNGSVNNKNLGVSLSTRFATKAFRFIASGDLIISDLINTRKIDGDASLKLEVSDITLDVYYASIVKSPTAPGYSTYAKGYEGYAERSWKKLLSVMATYKVYMDDWTITTSVKARNLVFSRVFGGSVDVANDVLDVMVYGDYAQVARTFDVGVKASYAFEDFTVAALAELDSAPETAKSIYAEVTASSDSIVDGATISLSYVASDIRTTRGSITAACTVVF